MRHASVPVYDQELVAIILGVGNKATAYDASDLRQLSLIGDQLLKILQRKRAQTELEAANTRLATQLVEIQQLQGRLREQATRDDLTGLFNRRYLEESLARELARAEREGCPLSIALMDIDRFKEINDTYGHAAGDEALRALGKLLAQDTRTSDLACRYGGDEFIVVLSSAAAENAFARAQEWCEAFQRQTFVFGERSFTTSLSIGISAYPAHATSAEKLIKAADEAMYLAKAGRNQVIIAHLSPRDAQPG